MRNEFGGIYRDETTRVWRPSGRRGPVRTDVLPHRVGVLATSWGHWAGAGGMRGQFALLADGRVTFSRDSSAPWSQVTPYRAAAAELANVALCRRDRGRGSVYAPNLLVRLTSGQEQGR